MLDFLKILTLTQPFKGFLNLRRSRVPYGAHKELLLDPVMIQMKQGIIPTSRRSLLQEQKADLLPRCHNAVQCLFIYELSDVRVSISDDIKSNDKMTTNCKIIGRERLQLNPYPTAFP